MTKQIFSSLTFVILRQLSDGDFHSGEELARSLGYSRSSIWEALRNVDLLGIELYRVRGRGYRLAEPLSLLNTKQLTRELGVHSPWRIELVDMLPSTNTALLERAQYEDIHGQALVAELQTAGRGRLGRSWIAALGGSLTFSLGWRFSQGVAALSGLSLAIGVALVRALGAYTDQVQLKWPNDLLARNRKLGGILIEVNGDALGPSTAVIGIGINLHLTQTIRDKIDAPMIDLAELCAPPPARNKLLAAMLLELGKALEAYNKNGFTPFREEWHQHHALQNKQVNLRSPRGTIAQGKLIGVDHDAALLLDTPTGRQRYLSGELTLRTN